jgi:hypothetical protein
MADELLNFETAMDELREAYKTASGNVAAQAVIKSKFDAVVMEKNKYILGNLGTRAGELAAFSRTVEEAIDFIRNYVANFPLGKLEAVAAEAKEHNGIEVAAFEDIAAAKSLV